MKLFTKGFASVASFAGVQILGKSLLLLAMYILSFGLSSEKFGYISLAQSTFMLFLVLLGANLQSAVVRYYPEYGFWGIVKSLRPFLVLQSLLAVLVSICMLAVIGLFSNVSELRYFAILPSAGLLASYVLALSVVARYKNDIFGYSLTALPKPFLVLLVSMLVLLEKGEPVLFFVLALLLSSVMVVFFKSRYVHQVKVSNNFLPFSVILKYAAPLFLVQIMALVNNVADKYILLAFVSISEIGLYAKAYLYGSSLGILLDSLMLLWAPYVMRHRSNVLRWALRWGKVVNFILLLSSVLIALLGCFVFFDGLAFFEGLDTDFWVCFILIVAAYISRVGYQIFVPLLNAYDRTKTTAYLSLVGALVGVVLNFLLIPVLGIIGAALATLASFACFSVFALFAVNGIEQLEEN